MAGLRGLARSAYKAQAFADCDVTTKSMKLFRHYWEHRKECSPFQLASYRKNRKAKQRSGKK